MIFDSDDIFRRDTQESKDKPDDFEQFMSFHLTMIEWLKGTCNRLKSLRAEYWRRTGHFGARSDKYPYLVSEDEDW